MDVCTGAECWLLVQYSLPSTCGQLLPDCCLSCYADPQEAMGHGQHMQHLAEVLRPSPSASTSRHLLCMLMMSASVKCTQASTSLFCL